MTEDLAMAGVSVDTGAGSIRLSVKQSLYPLDAVFGAAFCFIDRCYVLLDQDSSDAWHVHLSTKDPNEPVEGLRSLIGEFGNELLSNAFRLRLTEQNRSTIEAVTLQAISGAMGPPSLDELEDFDFSSEEFDDPLGIAQSWEEKYKKKTPEQGTGDAVPSNDAAPSADGESATKSEGK